LFPDWNFVLSCKMFAQHAQIAIIKISRLQMVSIATVLTLLLFPSLAAFCSGNSHSAKNITEQSTGIYSHTGTHTLLMATYGFLKSSILHHIYLNVPSVLITFGSNRSSSSALLFAILWGATNEYDYQYIMDWVKLRVEIRNTNNIKMDSIQGPKYIHSGINSKVS